ncbi:MAG: oligosaccharide flippase family protein [Lachnospiraceae bacterium]|nr:oligosaccharide flippase family protein [Lachnospiraceae bacterium]
MGRKKSLVRNTFILSLGRLLPRFTALVTLPIYTAMLTRAEYGSYDLIVIIQYIIENSVLIQIGQAMFRFLIDFEDEEKGKNVITTGIVFALAPALLSTFFLGAAYSAYGLKCCIAISLYMIIVAYYNIFAQIARGLKKTREYSIAAIIQALANMALVLFLLNGLNLGLFGLFVCVDLAYLIGAVFLFTACGIPRYFKPDYFDKKLLREMLSYSWPMVPNTLSLWIIGVCDKFIIRIFLGLEQNGIYAIAQKIPNLFSIAYGTFNLAWQESAFTSVTDEDHERYYSEIFSMLFRFLVGCMLLLMAATPILFFLLIRGDYDAAYSQMPILYIAILLDCIAAFLGSIYLAKKATKSVGITSVLGAAINCIINLTMIQRFGLYAASVSTAVSYLILILYRIYDLRRRGLARIKYEKSVIIASAMLLAVSAVLCFQRNAICDAANILLGGSAAFLLNRKMLGLIIKYILTKLVSRHTRTK